MDNFKQPERLQSQRVELREDDSVKEVVQVPADSDDQTAIGVGFRHYKILGHLGLGGMSDVYKCEDQSLHRIVAIKVVRAVDADMAKRFQIEGKALAKLEHPNIVKVYGFDCTTEGRPFLVMEYVEGVSLSSILSSGNPLTVERTLRLAGQICDALAAAHAASIIHRDLKPSNILIVNAGTPDEQIKLLDFGIAKIEDDISKQLTKTGEVFGTPLYMSPEQVLGKKLDARTDQYSLGCIIYEMLTGRPPFERDSHLAVMMARTQEDAPSLSKTQYSIPTHVEMAVETLLERQPEDRFPTIDDAKKALLHQVQIATSPSLRRQTSNIRKAPNYLLVLLIVAVALLSIQLARTHHLGYWKETATENTNLVKNGTFGGVEIQSQGWTELKPKDSLPGWTVDSGSVDVVQAWPAADGQTSVDLNGSTAGTISQTISTEPGSEYIVRLKVAASPQLAGSPATFEISAGGPSKVIELPADPKDWTKINWQPVEWSFRAHAPLTNLKFRSLTPNKCGPCIDDVKVSRKESALEILQNLFVHARSKQP